MFHQYMELSLGLITGDKIRLGKFLKDPCHTMNLLRLSWSETGDQQVKIPQNICKYLETEQYAAKWIMDYTRNQTGNLKTA